MNVRKTRELNPIDPANAGADKRSTVVRRRRCDLLDYLEFGVSVLTLVAVIVYASFTYGQLVVMSENLKESRSLVAEQIKASEAAQKTAVETQRLVEEQKRATAAAEQAAEAATTSAAQAKRSNEGAERALRLTQLADVELNNIECTNRGSETYYPPFGTLPLRLHSLI